MIDTKQLRIGNLLLNRNEIIHVSNISDWFINMEFNGVSGDRDCELDLDFIFPIPLSEEILLKCGFKKMYEKIKSVMRHLFFI